MAAHFGLRLRKLPRYVRINFQESNSVRRLYFSFSLWACLSFVLGSAEALKVSMPAQKTAILGTNVTLQCKISDYPPPELDIKKTIFIWYLETSEGNKVEQLYSVVDGKHSSNRKGSRLDTIQLKNGNASLFLPQIQLNEEGKYMCVVITSNRVEGATILDLVVEPTVQLSPKELEIENGNVMTLRCSVNKFYPDSIIILWQKHSKHTSDKNILAEDICMGTSVRNGDGTYNTTSKLRLQPSLQDQGNVYSCIVQHKSFARYPVYNVTLTVTEPYSTTPLTIGLVLCFLISFLLVGLVLYIVFLKKYPPSVEMVGSEELKHLEETQLQCLISHFRPKPLQVDLFLVIEPQKTKQKIASWPTSVEKCTEDDENFPFLGNLEDMFKAYPELKSKPKNYYDFQWKICMNPDVQKLKKFQLLLEIKHEGFRHGLCTKTKSFKVIVVAPKVDKIECKPAVPECGKPITLSCLLREYHPPECAIYWRKGFEELLDATIKTEEPQLDITSMLYSRRSEITFTPSSEDHEVEFFVEINHCTKIVRKGYKVLLKDFPKVSNIVIEPSDADYGESVNLTCEVTDFNPKNISTHWLLGDKSVRNYDVTEDLDMDANGCYKLTSAFELKATASVCDKVICFKVNNARLTKSITRKVNLKLPVKRPVLTEIKASPDHQNILFEISISQFAPDDIQVRWYQGSRQISENINPRNIEIGEDHLCYFVSKIHLNPKDLRFEKTIRCEVKHSTSTEEKSLTLNTTDFSDLEETQHHHHES